LDAGTGDQDFGAAEPSGGTKKFKDARRGWSGSSSFIAGAHAAVTISAALLVIVAGAILSAAQGRKYRVPA